MPEFITYDVEYTNVKPYMNMHLGSGKIRISVLKSAKSVKGKLKKAVEQKLNSLGVRIDAYAEVKDSGNEPV